MSLTSKYIFYFKGNHFSEKKKTKQTHTDQVDIVI